jgi:hypothetical protein
MVPRPRLHLIRVHGVLVPNARMRPQVVPAGPHDDDGTRLDSEAVEPDDAHRWASRIGCARLLKRVFDFDLEHCPNCGGELKIIAAVLETAVIELSNPERQGTASKRPMGSVASSAHSWP